MTQEQFVDYGNALEIYSDGLARIELLGANLVWVDYRLQPTPDDPDIFEKVVAVRVIMPISAIPDVVRKIFECFGAHVAQRTWGKWGRYRKVPELHH